VPPPSAGTPKTEGIEEGSVDGYTSAVVVMAAQCSADTSLEHESDKGRSESPVDTSTPTLRERANSRLSSPYAFRCRRFTAKVAKEAGEGDMGQMQVFSSMDTEFPCPATFRLPLSAILDAAAFAEPLVTASEKCMALSPSPAASTMEVEMQVRLKCASLEACVSINTGLIQTACFVHSESLHIFLQSKGVVGEKSLSIEIAHVLLETEGIMFNKPSGHERESRGRSMLLNVKGVCSNSKINRALDQSYYEARVSDALSMTLRLDELLLWKETMLCCSRIQAGKCSIAAVREAGKGLTQCLKQQLPRHRFLYHASWGSGPIVVVSRQKGTEQSGELTFGGAYLEQCCYADKHTFFVPDTVLAPSSWTLSWSISAKASGNALVKTSTFRMESPDPVEVHLSPLKLEGFKRIADIPKILFPSPSSPIVNAPIWLTESKMNIECAAIELVLQLPWLDQTLPRLHILGHGAKFGHAKGTNGSTTFSMFGKGLRAYADLAAGTSNLCSTLNSLSPQLSQFLPENDVVNLQKALQIPAPTQTSAPSSIPILLGRGQDDLFSMSWDNSPSGKMVRLEGKFAEYQVLFYFPLYFALSRFVSGSPTRANTSRSSVKGDGSGRDAGNSTGKLILSPLKLYVLDGPLDEARFAVRFSIESLVLTVR